MPKRRPLSEDSIRELKAAARAARTADDLRRALGVLLPEAFGLSRHRTAEALGCGTASMDRQKRGYRRSGLSGLRDARRRPLAAGAAGELRAALQRARSARDCQRIQCVLLLEELGLEVVRVAALLGLRREVVSTLQSQYRRHGLAALLGAGSGSPAPGSPPAAVPPGAISGNTTRKLGLAMRNARGLTEFRQAQCLYLRVGLGLAVKQVAGIVGWNERAVMRLQRRYRLEGDEVLRGPGRGRRRWRLMSVTREFKVLHKLCHGKYAGFLLNFDEIHQAFEEEAGCPVHFSVVQEILGRHGWHHAAVIIIPGQASGH
ncbi:MAG TPA: hypothetical protein VL523_16465 [Terriglobia bacterium]|nr:hypothetical protein [Terriglobia bacterium]